MNLTNSVKEEIGEPIKECCKQAFEHGKNAISTKCKKNCCKKSFIKGAFLSFGSINASAGYNLEFNSNDYEFSHIIYNILKPLNLNISFKRNNKKYKVYALDKDSVCGILAYLDAFNTSLEINSLIAKRNMILRTNQILNCDIANLDKTVKASVRQLKAINALKGKLDEKLDIVARARIEYPDSPYDELKDIVGVSKSTIKYRLNKIVKLYEESINDKI